MERLHTLYDKPLGNIGEVVMEPMELPLPCSVPICYIPLFISINYHKKVAAC